MGYVKIGRLQNNYMIYHIYWGTSGNSGLYTDEIYKLLEKEGYKQRVFVNFYFPFDYGDKIFFRKGDIANSKYTGLARKLFQLQETLCGFLKIIYCAFRQKPKIVNFSHVGSSYFFTYLFLKFLKYLSKTKLVITCHDVMPLSLGPRSQNEMKYRSKIFHIADFLLVHNRNSILELHINFDINKNKILFHPFPIMDLTKMPPRTKRNFTSVDFLFIGHLRKSKGIELLLEAWKDFYRINSNAKLRVCGKQPENVSFDKKQLENCGVEFDLRFIDDDDYYYYVKAARYVIFPYLLGTNSGVISTVLSLGTSVITSDLPMFKENELINSDDMFKTGNKQSLINKLNEKYYKNAKHSEDKVTSYREKFNIQTINVYKQLYK